MMLLLACTGAPTPEAPADSAAPSDAPPTGWDWEAPASERDPPPDADALAASLSDVVDRVARLEPVLMHHAWAITHARHGSVHCPALVPHNGMTHWREDLCASDDGSLFRGWSLYFYNRAPDDAPAPGPGEPFMVENGWLSGQSLIEIADGTVLRSYGDVAWTWRRVDDVEERLGQVFGDFDWDDPLAEGTWLNSAITVELTFLHRDGPDGREARLDVALGALPGAVTAATLDDFVLSDVDGRCAQEPDGRVRLRDAEGRWLEVLFDGADAVGAACDGCGEAWLDDEALGRVCVDFAPLLGWSGRGRF